MRVISSAAAKGGVGKTSIAVNLATLAARSGRSTLLWDLDAQAASTHCLRAEPVLRGGAAKLLAGKRDLGSFVTHTFIDGLDLVPADADLRLTDTMLADRRRPQRVLRRALGTVSGDYEVVILDCPPGLGLVTEAVLAASDVVIMPIVPAPLAVRGLGQTIEFVESAGTGAEPLAVLSMVDRRKVLHRQVLERVAGHEHFSAAVIPLSDSVERMGLEQMPSVLASPRSLSTAALTELWAEVADL